MLTSKHVGTEITPGDNIPSSELDSGPPVGINQDLVAQPVRDELLASCRVAKLTKFVGELGLASAGKLDSAFKGANVSFIHERQKYTRNLVDVNKELCFSADKDSCTVLNMRQAKKKPAQPIPKPARKRKSDPEVGPDGRTLSQRLLKLMSERGIGQTELARMCSDLYAQFVPAEEDKVKQQHIFNLIRGQSNAWSVPLVAAVLDVNDLWLQCGIGPPERGRKAT